MTDLASAGNAAESARAYSHLDPAFAADPYPLFRALREECPVARSDQLGGFFLVTRYEDSLAVMQDAALYSSKYTTIPDIEVGPIPPLNLDPPAHTRYRQILLPFFTPTRAANLEPVARETARQLAHGLRSGDDVYLNYCFPMPTVVISQILGVDAVDQERFSKWIEVIVDMGHDSPGADQVNSDLFTYLYTLLQQREHTPEDDLLTFLLTAEVSGEPLTEFERLGMASLLLIAGIDTTANTLANSIWYLAQDEDARRRLVADPSLIPSAVEEFLRMFAPVSSRRTPTEDVEVAGCPLAEGDAVLVSIPSANRDERRFPDAEQVVIDREDNTHIAFGAGVHRCLGAHIARMELRVGLEEFLAAVPDFELADPSAVMWKTGTIRGPKRVPLRF